MPRGPAGGHVHVLPLQAPQVWRSPCPLHPADSQFLCSWFALWDDKACVWTRGSGTLVFRSWGTSGQGLSLPSCSADPRLCSAVGGREGSTAMEEMSGARQGSASSSYNPCRVEKLPELEPGCAGSGAGQGWSLGGLPLVRQAGPHRETGAGGAEPGPLWEDSACSSALSGPAASTPPLWSSSFKQQFCVPPRHPTPLLPA